MRADLRLPWPVLVEDVVGQWRDGLMEAWLRRASPIWAECACSSWQERAAGLRRMAHWQLHGLIPELERLRTEVERHGALELTFRRGEKSAAHVPRSVLPSLTPVQRRQLDERLVDFDALVELRLAEVPALSVELTRRCVAEQSGIAPGIYPVSEILDQVLGRLAGDGLGGEQVRAGLLQTDGEKVRTGGQQADGEQLADDGHDSDGGRGSIEAAVRRLYGRLGLSAPYVLWANSPAQAEVIAEVLADLCAAMIAVPGGFPELELELAWMTHRGRLDAAMSAAVTGAAWHVFTAPEPAQRLLPVLGRVALLKSRALVELAGRLGLDASVLANRLRSGDHTLAAQVDSHTGVRAPLVRSVERAIDRILDPVLPRALASDPWFTPGAVEELGLRGPDDLPGLTEVLTLRRELYSWSGTRGVVILTENPEDIHLDPAGLLHHERGPAARWSDGWGVYFWHGTEVPADLVEHGWTIGRTLAERNVEVRRCAIEHMGWDRFVAGARLRLVGGPARDPANPGFDLTLYDLPTDLLDRAQLRLLLCTNASVERDGTRRQFGLTVPARFSDPVAAAAWTFGLSRAQYASLEVAT